MHRVNISREHAEVRVFFLQRLFVGNVPLCRYGGIVRHDAYSWGQIDPQKTTHQIDRICGARVDCAEASARSFCVCVWGTPFSGCRCFRGFIAENLRNCISAVIRGALHQRQKQQGPTTTATCYVVSLSQARRRIKPGKDLVLKCRNRVLFRGQEIRDFLIPG
jgi:hypothetical protein